MQRLLRLFRDVPTRRERPGLRDGRWELRGLLLGSGLQRRKMRWRDRRRIVRHDLLWLLRRQRVLHQPRKFSDGLRTERFHVPGVRRRTDLHERSLREFDLYGLLQRNRVRGWIGRYRLREWRRGLRRLHGKRADL